MFDQTQRIAKELTLLGIPDSYTTKFDGVNLETVLERVEDLPDPEVSHLIPKILDFASDKLTEGVKCLIVSNMLLRFPFNF